MSGMKSSSKRMEKWSNRGEHRQHDLLYVSLAWSDIGCVVHVTQVNTEAAHGKELQFFKATPGASANQDSTD